ncbi:adenosine receptor A2b-like [Actinia tenebrosa]|uniref:Adenosine receptor A2b-like n=1 Tax=Actinia tenebrosa TaxID=6105 RepID=A0A6P8IBD3_ACTTE|nr:adenosine receptor A2b-like [Actinia tenebrosa]XP_031562750.1 adenosine receptor A2b-like [Actinia tenebrosa]XP_031562751.1 adenosine receptor A2b-like [Actinia tenebrosa]XP_031562752.1 adenosine receptor A2b-like [Actinia tenebrosa]XP_031562753.1 adenosine receptor A2b-like [Actinia tenebrosa]XP_031562754.1 adenosine receptor A2b-like [Actinia tenebrosa]
MNSSSNSSSSLQNQSAPSHNNAGWCTAFAVEAIIITIGNIISILALIYMKSPRKLRRWFLVSLSIADLFVGALALPMYVYFLSASSQTMNKTLLLFQFAYNAVDIFSGLASVFTLTVISLERLYAVLLPLIHRSTRRRYYMIVIGILWFLAALISGLFWMTNVVQMLPPGLFIYTMTICSFASVGIIIVVYVAVWIKIKFFLHKRSRLLGPGEERNIFIALGIVTVVFVVTWLPFNIMNLIANFHVSLLKNLSFNVIFFVKLLHYSNSAINPIVYSLKIPEFRRSCISLFTKTEHDYLLKTRETRL